VKSIEPHELPRLTAEVAAMAQHNRREEFNQWIKERTMIDRVRLVMYWSMCSIAMRKVADPVSQGLHLTEDDRAMFTSIIDMMRGTGDMSPYPYPAATVMTWLDAASRSDWAQIGDSVGRMGLHAFPDHAWALVFTMQTFTGDNTTHRFLIQRAAMLRVSMWQAATKLRNHEWGTQDLEAIFEVSRHLDDTAPMTPMDDRKG
jgi:hypothetical protein